MVVIVVCFLFVNWLRNSFVIVDWYIFYIFLCSVCFLLVMFVNVVWLLLVDCVCVMSLFCFS